MATLAPDDRVIYLLTVFKHSNLPQPDYTAIAEELGVNTAQNAQRRFCSLIQKYGWDLVNDQIVGPDGSTCGDGGTPATNAPPARKARAKRTPVKKAAAGETPVKKRKLSESIVDSASENEVKQEDQAKDEGEKAEAKEKQTGEAAVDDRSG